MHKGEIMAGNHAIEQKRNTVPSPSTEEPVSLPPADLSQKKDKGKATSEPQTLDSLAGVQLAHAKLPRDPGKSPKTSTHRYIKPKVDISRFGTMVFPEPGYECSNLSPETARHYYQIYINGKGSEFKQALEQAQTEANNTGHPMLLLYNETEDGFTDLYKSVGSAISSRLGAAGEETVGQLEEILWTLHEHYCDREGESYEDQLLIRVHGYSQGALIARNATTRFFRDFTKDSSLGEELAYEFGDHIEMDTSGVGSLDFRAEISKVRAHLHDGDPVAWLTWGASVAKKPYYWGRGEKREAPESRVRDSRSEHAHAVYNREHPEAYVEQDARKSAVAEFLNDLRRGLLSDKRATEMLLAAISSDQDDGVVFCAEFLEQSGFAVEGSSQIKIKDYIVPSDDPDKPDVAGGLRRRYAAGFAARLAGKTDRLCAEVKRVLEGDRHGHELKKQILEEAYQRDDDFAEGLEKLIPDDVLWKDSPVKLGSVTLSEKFSDQMREISARRFLKKAKAQESYWSWGIKRLDYDDFAQKLCKELLSESNSDRMKTQFLAQAFDLVWDEDKLSAAIRKIGKVSTDRTSFSLAARGRTCSFSITRETAQALN